MIGTHTCHENAQCNDLVDGFSCECKSDQLDRNPENPGTDCVPDFDCCSRMELSFSGNVFTCSKSFEVRVAQDDNLIMGEIAPSLILCIFGRKTIYEKLKKIKLGADYVSEIFFFEDFALQ